jgi:hypothetical protein
MENLVFLAGYIAWKGETEASKEETPVKKYQRLNCEVRPGFVSSCLFHCMII